MKGLVVGMGVSGLSVARHWLRSGAVELVVAVDDRAQPPCADAFVQLGVACQFPVAYSQWGEKDWTGYDIIALSPGVSPPSLSRSDDEELHPHWTNDAQIFSQQWRASAPDSSRLLAVTGTNGKSSVVALAQHLCTTAGLSAAAVGNIGTPMLDALGQWQRAQQFPQVAVVELSSFHLEIARGFVSDAAVVLNIGNDHLDRHGNIQNYTSIKRRVYAQTKRAVVNVSDAAVRDIASTCHAVTAYAGGNCNGKHNALPARWWRCDAVITCARGVQFVIASMSEACRMMLDHVVATLALLDGLRLPPAVIAAGLASFAGLPHRLQWVVDLDGVAFVNDSKATNTEAVVHAVSTLRRRTVLIAGGIRKNNFAALAAVKTHLRHVIIIGQDAAATAADCNALNISHERASGLTAAVQRASAIAQAGDAVLLSPGGASFDQFDDYQKRGEAFMQAVASLSSTVSAAVQPQGRLA